MVLPEKYYKTVFILIIKSLNEISRNAEKLGGSFTVEKLLQNFPLIFSMSRFLNCRISPLKAFVFHPKQIYLQKND